MLHNNHLYVPTCAIGERRKEKKEKKAFLEMEMLYVYSTPYTYLPLRLLFPEMRTVTMAIPAISGPSDSYPFLALIPFRYIVLHIQFSLL